MIKSELRSKYKSLRKNLSAKDREQMSVEIIAGLLRNFDLTNKKISTFLPIEKFHEVNTWPLVRINAQFSLPVVDYENNQLQHIIYQDKKQIKVNDWGIPEPVYGETIDVKDLDFVLVPLLAYDKEGNRVGYGKGFYDGFLNKCSNKCQFIGLSYFEPEDKIEGIYEGDKRLHFCVTPLRIVEF